MATKENNLIKRYPPNYRFNFGAFKEQKEVPIIIDNFGESVTDKESYRLSLASKRGTISSMIGSYQQGAYMFEDGKYDSLKDFSYALRKDLSIVELDEYIENMQARLETADESLKADIQSQIKKAQAAKAEAAKVEAAKVENVRAQKGNNSDSSE